MRERIQEVGNALYFVGADGSRWRVYDVCFGPPHSQPGKRQGFKPPEHRAKARSTSTSPEIMRVRSAW